MKIHSPICVFVCVALTILMGTTAFSQNSVLSFGKWYKVAVSKNGVYKIDATLFASMGFDLSKTDPRNIMVYGNEGGMLPQANNADRPFDLIENAIYVAGENDGTFDSNDYILFYGQGPDKSFFDVPSGLFSYQKNLYADKNYYFITVGESTGKRAGSSADAGSSFPVINEFENFVHHELDQHNELKSGRDWFGETFDLTTEYTFSLPLSDVVTGSTVKLISDVMAKSFSGSTTFKVLINGTLVLEQSIAAISNTQYDIKGRDKRDIVSFSSDAISAPGRSTQEVKYQYVKSETGISAGYLDNFLLQVKQKLALYDKQTCFRSTASLNNSVSKFEIDRTTSQTRVWDVTNPYEPLVQSVSFAEPKISFSTSTGVLKEFIVFGSDIASPEMIGPVENQNIKGQSTPAFIIVTHPDLEVEALRLAAHRNSFSNMSTRVFTTEDIYNEFSGGRQDVTAIRDLAKYFYDRNQGLKAILMMGKGSYDYKARVSGNVNLVPIYESRNSLHPLLTYSSDDYYGFMEDAEGNWNEDLAGNHTMDISVGRIPAKNPAEAAQVVDKIIRYDTDISLFGKWRNEIVFVADDGDPSHSHQNDANQLAEFIENTQGQINIKKVFLDRFEQISKPSGEISPETSAEIQKAFDNGSLVINYTGHGSEQVWAQEKILDDVMIRNLENKKLPLLVTATCEFGRQDDPALISSAELCMLRKDAGAIALVTTSRPVNASTNFLLNEAFYNSFFQKENNQYMPLGEIFKRTKNSSLIGVGNRNFSLIGDPTLRLAMPDYAIEVTEIKTASGDSTLKALSSVTVKGRVTGSTGEIITDFNGVLEAILFDKETTFVTRGDEESQPYTYKQWYNALFRGKASVINGEFEFHFVIPKNIAYTVDIGKLSLYASDTKNNYEASGSSKDFFIGGSEPNPEPDDTPPVMALFMGDTTFINGGLTSSNTTLIARLADYHGINISSYGVGNSIIAILDDQETFVLNDYYESDLDDFTKGTFAFPLKGLAIGNHTIIVKAWDTYNNPVEGVINFVVADEEGLIIEAFGNYPNPFNVSTTLFFTHNRSGDDLQVSLAIYDYTGLVAGSWEFSIPFSTYQVNLLELTRHDPIFENHSGAIYFARLVVRSVSNSSKNEQVTKLLLAN